MNSIERKLKYVNLYMVRDLDDIKDYPLPEGYKFVFFDDGDEKYWAEIETSSGEFLSTEEALQAFNHYYGEHYDDLKKMCLFIENDLGEKVATATAFYLDEEVDGITGNVHWVSVRKDYQGKGLSKPLISKTLQVLRDLGHKKTMLHTQTTTWLAAKVYLDMGFNPYNLEEDYLGWQILKHITNHEKLNNVKDIDDSEMYDPLYVAAYEFLKSKYDEPFTYKVWDEKAPIIGVSKDGVVDYYKYTFNNGVLTTVPDTEEYKKIK